MSHDELEGVDSGWFVIPQFIPLVNTGAKDLTVSFEAPDGDSHRDVTYAIQFPNAEDAKGLAELLNPS